MKALLVQTPCVKICVLDPGTGYCIGCGRDEIASWLDVNEALPVEADWVSR